MTALDVATFFAISLGAAAAIFWKIYLVARSSIETPRYRQADRPVKEFWPPIAVGRAVR
jgi:hypothetical protein